MERKASSSGAKAQQRTDNEDRSLAYRQWHRTLGPELICSDVDQIEWRFVDGKPKAVAVLELTRIDEGDGSPAYRDAIIERFTKRDGQATLIRTVGAALHAPAWIVLFRRDLAKFWLYNLDKPAAGWTELTRAVYTLWLTRGCPAMKTIDEQLEDVGAAAFGMQYHRTE